MTSGETIEQSAGIAGRVVKLRHSSERHASAGGFKTFIIPRNAIPSLTNATAIYGMLDASRTDQRTVYSGNRQLTATLAGWRCVAWSYLLESDCVLFQFQHRHIAAGDGSGRRLLAHMFVRFGMPRFEPAEKSA